MTVVSVVRDRMISGSRFNLSYAVSLRTVWDSRDPDSGEGGEGGQGRPRSEKNHNPSSYSVKENLNLATGFP